MTRTTEKPTQTTPAKRPRQRAIAIFATHAQPVRVLAPTTSTPYFTVTFYEPGKPRQLRTTYGKDKAAAVDWAARKADALKLAQGTPVPERLFASIGELVEHFLDMSRNGKRWRRRTLEKYEELDRRFLRGPIRAVQARHLTEEDLQALITAHEDRCKPGYLRTLRSFLTNLVDFGIRRHYFLDGQLRDIQLTVRIPDAEIEDDGYVDPKTLPPVAVLHALVAAITSPLHRTMVELALITGLRFSELVALTWESVDLARGKIEVHAKVAESNRGQKWLEATKNRRRREVVFSPELAPRLHELVAAAKADAEGGGKGLLFPATQLGWISRHNFAKRVWRPAVASVPGWRPEWSFHTLRHCAAIAMIEDLGWPITRVSQLLGHRDVSVTERLYLNGRADYADTAAASLGWPAA